jgi:ribonuclease HI
LGLQKLRAMEIRRVVLKSDSQVITGHVDKSSKERDPKLEKYLDTVRRMEASFEGFSVKNIPRGENEQATLLAKCLNQRHMGSHSPRKCSSKLSKNLQSNSWSERCLQFHLCTTRIGELKLYLSFKAIILRMTKLT